MRRAELLPFLLCSLIAVPAGAACIAPAVELGMNSQGLPNERWINAIVDRVDSETLARIRSTKRPFTDAEQGWAQLVEREAATICPRFEPINAAFQTVRPPRRLRILMGNQAGDDAFTAGRDTITFDLGVFAKAYGVSDGRGDLVGRLLLHEYSHLLLVPYMNRIGWSAERAGRDPFLQAVRILYNEGIANLRSIDDPKWVGPDGAPTPYARSIVAALEPVMIERLQRLEANPAPEEAARLLRNISQGPFAGKWGAVPIAVWLQAETGGSAERLRQWVEPGPQGILALAARNASPGGRQAFRRLLDAVPAHVARRGAARDWSLATP